MYRVYNGKCCGQKRPECLTEQPYFSWCLESDKKDTEQDGYEITVCRSDGKKICSTGVINSREVHNISCGEINLESAQDYYWYIKSFSSAGETAQSDYYFFSTGILDISQWEAEWIEPDIERKPCTDSRDGAKLLAGKMPYLDKPEKVLNPAVYFRKTFSACRKIRSAKAFVTAHGIYEMYINGIRYGKPLVPGFTVYKQYQEYQAYDITEAVREGKNVFGAIVADGWYLGKIGLMGIGNQYGENPAVLFQIRILYQDGTEEVVASDKTVRAAAGAFAYADLYVGEMYDERKELKGWQLPEYDSSDWRSVTTKKYGYDQLRGSSDEPVDYLYKREPKKIFYSEAGELLVDAGENIAGYISIAGRAQAGDQISLEYCEVLDEKGNFLRNIIGQNKNQTDKYIAGEDGEFYYKPTFTYHGFQYVRISGISPDEISGIKVYVLGSNMERTGDFVCSDPKLSRLQENIFRSQQGNMIYVPTDCPQREKAGWTGDMQVYAPTAGFLMDVEAFLRKWLANMRLEQRADGQIPHVIPDIPSNRCVSHGYPEICSSGWADACVIVPYVLYMIYGDPKILKENYTMMNRWMGYVEKKAATEVPGDRNDYSEESLQYQKYLWNTGFHYGDWLIPSLSREGVAKKPIEGAEMTKELVAPAMFAYTTKLMTEIADILGDDERKMHYADLNRKIKTAYTHEYLEEDGTLKLDYQGIYVLALAMELVPEKYRAGLTEHLVSLISQNNGCLDTGFLSIPFLLDVLYENGKKEEAFRLLFQEKCPSWLYEIKQGANTIWESWTNILPDGRKNSSSYNHFAFGCVGDFIYRRIIGIECLEPGYKKIAIRPDYTCGLKWVRGYYICISGKIRVSWVHTETNTVLDVKIPPNVKAEIFWEGRTETFGCGEYHFEN